MADLALIISFKCMPDSLQHWTEAGHSWRPHLVSVPVPSTTDDASPCFARQGRGQMCTFLESILKGFPVSFAMEMKFSSLVALESGWGCLSLQVTQDKGMPAEPGGRLIHSSNDFSQSSHLSSLVDKRGSAVDLMSDASKMNCPCSSAFSGVASASLEGNGISSGLMPPVACLHPAMESHDCSLGAKLNSDIVLSSLFQGFKGILTFFLVTLRHPEKLLMSRFLERLLAVVGISTLHACMAIQTV